VFLRYWWHLTGVKHVVSKVDDQPINVVIPSHVDPGKLIAKLTEVLGRSGSRRFNLFLVKSGEARDLEELKDLILSNYTWTINIYLLNDTRNLVPKICSGRIVLVSSGEMVRSLREHCHSNLEIEVVE